MSGFLCEDETIVSFFFITLLMSGACAWQLGRIIARIWGSQFQLLGYVLLLGIVNNFLHFALLERPFLSVHCYVIDTLALLGITSLGWRLMRMRQMTSQYGWLYERISFLRWKRNKA